MIFGWFRRKPKLVEDDITGSTIVTIECLDKWECQATFAALKKENDFLRSLTGIDNHTN